MPQNPEPTMSRNNPWIILFVVLIVCWSFYEMYPPTSRSLVQEFETRAVNRDTNFTGIVQRVQPLQRAAARTRVRQFAGGHRHEQHRAVFPVFQRDQQSCIPMFSS